MGAPGTFQAPQLRKLIGGVASTIGRLKDKRTITSVLIGSGAGNLEIRKAFKAISMACAMPSTPIRTCG